MNGAKSYMAIKIDLEKAYDRSSWNFILDFLRDFGLEENLINLVCKCTSSSSMNILSSGECTSEFFPSRSIRQGIHYHHIYLSFAWRDYPI